MKKLFLFIVIFSSSSPLFCAEWTGEREIEEVRVREVTGTAYMFTAKEGNWGPSGCPGATHITILENVELRKDILSVALAAKATGAKVKFEGDCVSGTIYFQANQILMK